MNKSSRNELLDKSLILNIAAIQRSFTCYLRYVFDPRNVDDLILLIRLLFLLCHDHWEVYAFLMVKLVLFQLPLFDIELLSLFLLIKPYLCKYAGLRTHWSDDLFTILFLLLFFLIVTYSQFFLFLSIVFDNLLIFFTAESITYILLAFF